MDENLGIFLWWPKALISDPSKHYPAWSRVNRQNHMQYNKNGYGKYVKETKTPLGWKVAAQHHLLVFNEWQGNPSNTEQAAAGPKTSLNKGKNTKMYFILQPPSHRHIYQTQ